MKREPVSGSQPTTWTIRGRAVSLARPLIMGIVNVTPDSFSESGAHASYQAALDHAKQLIDDGADLIDIGGESTRPGAADVPADEELQRVLPLIEALASGDVPVSIDTSKPVVMRAALDAGAAIVNDVAALRAPGAVEVVAASSCGVVVMHMQGTPRTMQTAPAYADVVSEVSDFLRERVGALVDAGVARERIVVDPGFGFGKTAAHNFALLRQLGRFAALGVPLLVGLSRKSMLGVATGRAVGERVVASAVAAVLAVQRGARIVRVHDVAATRDALRIWNAIEGEPQ
jgi:dihydropteroate synthase